MSQTNALQYLCIMAFNYLKHFTEHIGLSWGGKSILVKAFGNSTLTLLDRVYVSESLISK